MTNIKKCFMPECGGSGEIVQWQGGYWVGCKDCSAQTGFFEADTEALKAWNSIPRTKTSELTLRDRFAMAAMQGYLSNEKVLENINDEAGRQLELTRAAIAKHSYLLADAMIKEREK